MSKAAFPFAVIALYRAPHRREPGDEETALGREAEGHFYKAKQWQGGWQQLFRGQMLSGNILRVANILGLPLHILGEAAPGREGEHTPPCPAPPQAPQP